MANTLVKDETSKTPIVATDEFYINDVAGGDLDKKAIMSNVKTFMSLSPTLVTPALGTPASGVLTSCTGLPIGGLANGTDGELITWDSSGVAAAVAVGTATHVLTSNGVGAAPTFQAPPQGTESIIIAVGDESTPIFVADDKMTFRMPYAFTLTEVRASLTVAGLTSGTTTIDIEEAGSTILSTLITIDATEKTSESAATPPVISDSALADDAEITINVDAISAGEGEAGLKVYLIGTKT